MYKNQEKFSCKEVLSTIGSSVIIMDDAVATDEIKWTFIIPKGAKIKARILEDGGEISFVLM